MTATLRAIKDKAPEVGGKPIEPFGSPVVYATQRRLPKRSGLWRRDQIAAARRSTGA